MQTFKHNFMKHMLFMAILPICLICGCTEMYDDSEVKQSIAGLESRVSALETVLNAYKGGTLIKSVTTVVGGCSIVFTDGTSVQIVNGKDGKDGKDGNDGKDGKDGDTYIAEIWNEDKEVTFKLTDGRTFSIAKYCPLSIEFDSGDLLLMLPNQSRKIQYAITSQTEKVEIEVLSSADINSRVVPDTENPHMGYIYIKTGAAVSELYSKVVVLVTNGEQIIMRKLLFTDEGIDVVNDTDKTVSSEAKDVKLDFISSVPYEVCIPEDAKSWITYEPTKAAERQSIIISVAKNEGQFRTAEITVRSTDGKLSLTFIITQAADMNYAEGFDRPVLEDMYKSLKGKKWKYTSNWCTESPISSWGGVTVDPITGRVVELYFFEPDMSGDIPESIGQLTELRKLYIYCLSTTKIPEGLGKLTKLESLTIGALWQSGKHISGSFPESILSLQSLKHLDIHHHEITSIPSGIIKLSGLEELILNGNKLSGQIPEEICRLTKLRELDLSSNNLSGKIPSSIGALTNLEVLNLGTNDMSGEIPVGIGNLRNLRELNLGGNKLSGNIPAELSGLESLEHFALQDNKLTGNIPYVGYMRKLKYINLEQNGLSGNIPAELSDLPDLEFISLFSNAMTGEIPDGIANSGKLRELRLNYNGFTGGLPSSLLSHPESFELLWLDHNELSGKIPADFYQTKWWRNSWGCVTEGNSFDFTDASFPGPDLCFDVESLGDMKFHIDEEYKKNSYTILFQWAVNCSHLDSAVEMLVNIHNQYSDKGVKIIGRTLWESKTSSIFQMMPWKSYFSQQLDYPTYLAPTITVINNDGMVVFSDLLQNRADLPDVMARLVAKGTSAQ